MRSTILTPADAAIVIGICFGDAILLSVRAVRSGFPVTPFTDGGALWGIGAEVVLATAALLFLPHGSSMSSPCCPYRRCVALLRGWDGFWRRGSAASP